MVILWVARIREPEIGDRPRRRGPRPHTGPIAGCRFRPAGPIRLEVDLAATYRRAGPPRRKDLPMSRTRRPALPARAIPWTAETRWYSTGWVAPVGLQL